MQGRVSVFLSGKMISTGAEGGVYSILQLHHALELLVSNKLAKMIEFRMQGPESRATLNIQRTLDVKKVTGSFTNYIYEPDNLQE